MGACRKCGEVNPPHAVFCLACGVRLQFGDLRPDSRKPVTILFNDVVESTALGERFEPETVRRIMARYWQTVTQVCERHGGTVEKFIGDAVMAVFGIPTAKEDHAIRGLRAAVELREALGGAQRGARARVGRSARDPHGREQRPGRRGGSRRRAGARHRRRGERRRAARAGGAGRRDPDRRLDPLARRGTRSRPRRSSRSQLKGKAERVAAWTLVDVTAREGQLARRLDAPMLGRDAELALLRASLDRAVAERVGPACDRARSRRHREVAARARAAGGVGARARVLTGSCLPYGEGVAFRPLAEIVREAAGDDDRARRIERLSRATGTPAAIAEQVLQRRRHWRKQARPAGRATGRSGDSSRRLPRTGRSWSCSRTCTGPTRRCST